MNDSLSRIKSSIIKFKGLTAIGLATLISNAISALFWLYIAQLLGTENYGEISYYIAIAGITTVISFFGAGNTLVVYSAKGEKIQYPVFLIGIIASVVSSTVLFFMFHNIGVSLFVLGNVIFGLVTSDLLGKKLYKKYSIYLILQKITMVSLAIFFYYVIGHFGIILGMALSFFIPIFEVYAILKTSEKKIFLIRSKVGFIVNSYIMDLSRSFNGTIDKLIVAPMLGFGLLGNYQLGVQILSVLSILPGIVYNYTLTHDASGNSNSKLKKLIVLSSILLAIISIIISPIVIPYFFPKFTHAVTIIQIVSISIIPSTINLTYISKFLGNEKIRIVLIGSGIYLAVQISTLIVLGRTIGINGVAISLVLAAFSEMIYLYTRDYLLQKNQKVQDKIEINNSKPEKSFIRFLDKKIEFSNKPVISLIIIGVIGLLIRIYYFPLNVPLILDSLAYFLYSTDMSILGKIPTGYSFANNGWPIFLSFIFTVFRPEATLDYMNLQRIVTIFFSVITIVPVFYLCRKFLGTSYGIIGAAIFAFEPRIIQNSLLGITEPFYIFLTASSIALFFSSRIKLSYASFAIIAFASIVRSEGLFTFAPLFIMFIIRHRKDKKVILKLLAALSIFIIVIIPFALERIHANGNDQLTDRVLRNSNELVSISFSHNGLVSILKPALLNFVKLGGWSLIPIFIPVVPFGVYFLLKKRDFQNATLIALMISMLLPIIFAFYCCADTRYIYPIYPILCVLSIFTIKKVGDKIKTPNIFLVVIIGGILLTSGVFLDVKKYDYEYQKESYSIDRYIAKIANGVNDYYPEDSYILPSKLPSKWPVLSSSINFKPEIIPTMGFDSLTQYIKSSENKGLSHIVIDDHNNRLSFLSDVFYHKEKYPYLIEVYDSSEHGFKYHVKIFKIDYNNFNSFIH
jgi:O-antigen/teichoic acid export membrane protein